MRFTLAAFLGLAGLGSTSAVAVRSSAPVPPTQDPFYTAPKGFEHAKPGHIFRMRHAPGNLTAVMGANCSEAYHILYRTTDALYRPSWAVTTLLVPTHGNDDALVSYQIPYNSPDLNASPSYSLYAAALPDISSSLAEGWYVNVPDHEGPHSAFGAEVGQGYATLDSVRAALSAGTHLKDDARYVMWGYSGGSLASEFAAELQASYAPEMNFSAAALGGEPVNATTIMDSLANEGPYAGLIPLLLVGTTALYPEAREYLRDELKEDKVERFFSVMHMDAGTAFTAFEGEDLWTYFKRGKAVLDGEVLEKVTYGNWHMGFHGIPQMPLYQYHAVKDELAPIANIEALAERYCSVGVSILQERNTISDHLQEMTNGAARAKAYLKSALEGRLEEDYEVPGCVFRTVSVGPPE